MTAAEKFDYAGYAEAVTDYYMECVKDEMLDRITMFGMDAAFLRLCVELAEELCISVTEASELLWPVANKIYRAAEAANG